MAAIVPIAQATNTTAASAFAKAAEILGKTGSALSSSVTGATSATTGAVSSVSTTLGSALSTQTGSSILQTGYYAVFFLFFVFIILVIVNYTVTPIFSFAPGQPGILSVPGAITDDSLHWSSSLPHQDDYHPRLLEKLVGYDFKRNFSMSVDCYLPILSGIPIHKRVLFFKAQRGLTNSEATGGFWNGYTLNTDNTTLSSLRTFLVPTGSGVAKVSMIGYVDEQNRLSVDFIDGQNTPITLGPINNVPTADPFRVTVVAHEKLVELYINGRLAVSRALLNTLSSPISGKEAFYPAPNSWQISQTTATPGSCTAAAAASGIAMKVVNLHLWARPLSVAEVVHMSPSLPTAAQLDSVNSRAGTPPTDTSSLPSGSGTLTQGSSSSSQQSSYNPFKDIDTRSFLLILASLGAALYLFKNNRPTE